MIHFDFKKYCGKVDILEQYQPQWSTIQNQFLTDGKMNGWYTILEDTNILQKIEKESQFIQNNCDIFLVIGIGGSYLGAKAIIDMLQPTYNVSKPQILFVGTTLCSEELNEVLDYIEDKEIIVNVISKSGSTLETNITFQLVLEKMQKKYSENELQKRIIVTTDAEKGNLYELVKQKKYQHFIIPSNIGGRFSVLTPVGLLPIAVAGGNIKELLDGANYAKGKLEDAYYYASLRDFWYHNNKKVEAFVVYNPKLLYFTEWLKQLFAETQGKEEKALLPTSLLYTRDLHSLGQFLQQGNPIIFETHIFIEKKPSIMVNTYHLPLQTIEKMALESVCEAHLMNHTPSILLKMDEKNEWNIGYLIFFFMMSAMIGAYLLDVPYDNQPGVNGYKEKLQEKLWIEK